MAAVSLTSQINQDLRDWQKKKPLFFGKKQHKEGVKDKNELLTLSKDAVKGLEKRIREMKDKMKTL